MEFYVWLENKVEHWNDWIEEEEGIRYFFDTDSIYDDFRHSEQPLTADEWEEDELEVLRPLFNEWALIAKPFDYTSKDINDHRKERAADLRTQAMEMGYHNYSSENGGTWYMD